MRRYAETFFRHWISALLPIVVLPFAAVVLTLHPAQTSMVSTNIWVNQVTLGQLSYTDPSVTPAQNMATFLQQFLHSPSYDLRVAQRSTLYWQRVAPLPDRVNRVVADLSKNVDVQANGSNLVTISYAYSTKNSRLGVEIVRGLLQEAPHEIWLLNQQSLATGGASLVRQLRANQALLNKAVHSLGLYLQAHNIASQSIAEQALFDPQLSALYQSVQSAQADVQKADSRLAEIRQQGSVQGSFQVVDPPVVQPPGSGSRKKTLTTIVVAFIVGLLLSGAFIVTSTVLDHSLRHPDDVPDVLGLPVLGIVPYSRGLAEKTIGTG